MPHRFTILISGAGGLMRRVVETSQQPGSPFVVDRVIASRECPGIEKARSLKIPTAVIPPDSEDLWPRIEFPDAPDSILLLGYLHLLPIPPRWCNKALNIHPSLLPKFGGPGMYGRRVHAAVLRSGETTTGSTIHLADDRYDHGPVLHQIKVPVLAGDTPESLETRVIDAQHRQLVPFLTRWAAEHSVAVNCR